MQLNGKTIFYNRILPWHWSGNGPEMCARGSQSGNCRKVEEPHPKLPGTIHSVAEEVRQAGGKALALTLDVRDEEAMVAAAKQAAEHFGSIDVLINNAGAIKLSGVERPRSNASTSCTRSTHEPFWA